MTCTAPSLLTSFLVCIATSRGISVSDCKTRILGSGCNPGAVMGIAEKLYVNCWNGNSIGTETCRLPDHENPSVISVCMDRLLAGVVGCKFVISSCHWKDEYCVTVPGEDMTACTVSVGVYRIDGAMQRKWSTAGLTAL
jgi:hypothetical protein